MFWKLSKRRFAKQFLQAIRKLEPEALFRFDEDEFMLVDTQGDRRIHLANIYAEHCTVPRRHRAANLARLAQAFITNRDDVLPESFDEARTHLRPKIWCRSTFAMMELERRVTGTGEPLDIPLYPLGSHLYSSLVFDTEHAMRSVSSENLENWATTYYEAFEIACRNLEEESIVWSRIGDGFYSALSGDNYDSSRVLLLDRIQSMDVKGDHVAIVPQRDAMYVAGSEDEESLQIMFDLTEQTLSEQPRPLCPLPMILKDGEWTNWTVPQNHRLRERFDALEIQFLGQLYAEQKSLLDQLVDSGGLEAFPASFTAVREKDSNQLFSYCVWGQGVDTLLPKAQFVILVDDSGTRASGRWSHVREVLGDLMVQDESYYPPLWRVREFPGDALLSEVGVTEPFT